jgi:hypothetical protein
MRASVASWRGFKAGLACLAVSAVQTAWATEHGRDVAHASGFAMPPVSEASRDAATPALDLEPQARPPADRVSAFPSSQIPHLDLGLHPLDTVDRGQAIIDRLSAAADRAHEVGTIPIESRAEPLAQRMLNMSRDGLPLVHLWQGARGGFSLGFNARGKPGLWLVEKIR